MKIPGLSELVKDLTEFEPKLLGRLDTLINKMDELIKIMEDK